MSSIAGVSGAPSSWDSIDMSFRSEKPRGRNHKTLIEEATQEHSEEHNQTISLDGDEVNRLNQEGDQNLLLGS